MCDGKLYMSAPDKRCGNCDRWCGTTVGTQHKDGECLADAKPWVIKHGEYWAEPKEYFHAWNQCHRLQDWRPRNA
jgi:hypothetical protein